jgi:hypothetical protein
MVDATISNLIFRANCNAFLPFRNVTVTELRTQREGAKGFVAAAARRAQQPFAFAVKGIAAAKVSLTYCGER